MTTRRRVPRLAYSVQEARRISGVTQLTIYRWIRNGSLSAVKVGGLWMIPKSDTQLALMPDKCSINEVARALYVSEVTVQRWIRGGVLPAYKIDDRWIVTSADLGLLLHLPTEGTT